MDGKPTALILLGDANESYAIKKYLEFQDWQAISFKSLDKLWDSIPTYNKPLIIADVLVLSGPQRNLVDHPDLVNEMASLAFYCSNDSRPLLQSMLGHLHLGIIQKSAEYATGLLPILVRYEHWLKLNRELEVREQEKRSIKLQLLQVQEQRGKEQQLLLCHRKTQEINQALSQLVGQGFDFFIACAKVLQQENWITDFSFYGVLDQGRRLYSPELPAGKCHSLPEIFLPQQAVKGLDAECQALALQMFSNAGEGHIIILELEQLSEGPKYLLMLRTSDREMYQSLDFNQLEMVFDYHLLSLRPKQDVDLSVRSTWELASYLESVFHRFDEKHELVGELAGKGDEFGEMLAIDFHDLLNVIQENKMGRFYWQKMSRDLQARLRALLGDEISIVENGLTTTFVLSKTSNISPKLEVVQNVLRGFPLWRYFEHPNQTALWSLTLTAKLVPLAPTSLKQLSNVNAPTLHTFFRELT